jgi:hypothetical protein
MRHHYRDIAMSWLAPGESFTLQRNQDSYCANFQALQTPSNP